jgi:hypothetical protein
LSSAMIGSRTTRQAVSTYPLSIRRQLAAGHPQLVVRREAYKHRRQVGELHA